MIRERSKHVTSNKCLTLASLAAQTQEQLPTLQPGFEAWFANGGGTYYNPSFAAQNIFGLPDGPFKASASSRYGNYSTALIGNYSINWIKKVATEMKSGKDTRPFMAYIAPKACHDPFEPAPWYTDVWLPHWPATAPRPPSWNVSRAQLSKRAAAHSTDQI